MASLSDTDFEIFGLPCQFELNPNALNQAWMRLQEQTHPDRFVNASYQEQRLAMQWATRINEAKNRLSNPIERGIYWCELQGKKPRTHQSHLPSTLLMQQMEWRETLEEASTLDKLYSLHDEVRLEKKTKLTDLAQQIDQQHNAQAATETTQALLFIEKFLSELEKRIDTLEHAN